MKPIKKPPHLQSKKPLKRVEIIEIDSGMEDNINALKTEEAVKDHVFEKKEKVPDVAVKNNIVEKIVPTEQIEEPPKIVSAFKRNKTVKNTTADNPTAWPSVQEKANVLHTDDLKIVERSLGAQNIQTDKVIKSDKEAVENSFSAPKNSVQFNLTWKNLKTMDVKYMYLKSIDPLNFPKIFLESLDASIFSNILEVLAEEFIKNKDHVYDILESFTNVKRFCAITMFLTNDDKKSKCESLDMLSLLPRVEHTSVPCLYL